MLHVSLPIVTVLIYFWRSILESRLRYLESGLLFCIDNYKGWNLGLQLYLGNDEGWSLGLPLYLKFGEKTFEAYRIAHRIWRGGGMR